MGQQILRNCLAAGLLVLLLWISFGIIAFIMNVKFNAILIYDCALRCIMFFYCVFGILCAVAVLLKNKRSFNFITAIAVVKPVKKSIKDKMDSITMSCVKYLLFFFSLLFAITGLAILVVGGLLQSVYHNYSTFVNENFMFLPIFIIVAGAVIFIIAFFGCCGTVKENLCMISTFASLLLTIFIMEIVAAVGGYVFQNDLKDIISQKMTSSLQHYNTDADVARSWEILQTDLHCCGVTGVDDWKEKIPLSCCPDTRADEQCTKPNAYETGCLDTMYSFLEKNSMIIIIVAAVVALVQLIGVGFACCLAHSIHKGYECV